MGVIVVSGLVLVPTIAFLFALERKHRAITSSLPVARVAS
jgi:hypothetical protein